MIDLTQLTQEQQWGIAYATQVCNSQRPEGTPEVQTIEYATNVFRSFCESYYQLLLERKKELAISQFNALPPEQQQALLDQLQVPDVLP